MPLTLAGERYSQPESSSTYRTRSGHHNVTLMRSLGAPGSKVAVEVGSEEVQRSIGAARVDVEVLEVIAHDGRIRSGDVAR